MVFGIYSRAGIFYVRNTRFENSSHCDINTGIFWMFNSAQRVVSVGSKAFVCEDLWDQEHPCARSDLNAEGELLCIPGPLLPFPPGYETQGGATQPNMSCVDKTSAECYWGPVTASMILRDCHVDSWTGPIAVNISSFLQVHDCTFTNPTAPGAFAVGHRSGDPPGPMTRTDTGPGYFPIMLSNNTITPSSHQLRDPADTDPRKLNYSMPAGACPATGITAATCFLKNVWPVPTKVFEFATFLPKPSKPGQAATPEQTTAAVQACINAAAAAGGGATAYFPKGQYGMTKPIIVKGSDYTIGGSGFQTIFSATGAPTNLSLTGPIFAVQPGSKITIEFLQMIGPSGGMMGPGAIRLLVLGGLGTTDVKINGLQMQGYNEPKMFQTSGIRVEKFVPGDLLDAIYTDGDFHIVGNSGTVLNSFHWAGQMVIEPSKEERRLYAELALTQQEAPKSTGVVGELTRFACCDVDYTTKITGGQTYIAENFYQESGVNYMHAQGIPGAPAGTIVVSAIKTYITGNNCFPPKPCAPDEFTASVFDGWNGLAWFTAGDTDFQFGRHDNFSVSMILNGTSAPGKGTRLVHLMQQQNSQYIDFQMIDPNAQLTKVGNVKSNVTMTCEDPGDLLHEDSEAHLVAGMDALRRLARLDLQHHYLELGVTDTCGAM
jgi:hypothetical protein